MLLFGQALGEVDAPQGVADRTAQVVQDQRPGVLGEESRGPAVNVKERDGLSVGEQWNRRRGAPAELAAELEPGRHLCGMMQPVVDDL